MSGSKQVGTIGPCPQLVPRFGPSFYREMERLRDEPPAEDEES